MAETEAPSKKFPSSEFWLSLITTLMAVVMVLLKDHTRALAITSGVAAILSAGVFAFYRTPLLSEKPGWKTPMFWGSIATVIGSMAAAVSEFELSFLPKGVTQAASMIVAGLTAAGYTIYRNRLKIAFMARRLTP